MRWPRLAVLFLGLVPLLALGLVTADGERRDDRVRLFVHLWNVDDTATVFVGCRARVMVRFPATRTVRLEVTPRAVITIQVDNDRHVYSWGVLVKADGRTLIASEEGVAGLFGANGNEPAREFQTVFNRSVRVDGTPAANPRCVRV